MSLLRQFPARFVRSRFRMDHRPQLPVFRFAPRLAEQAIKRLGFLLFHNALAVGRVRDDDAVFGLAVKFCRICFFKADYIRNTGALGVFTGDNERVGVYIRTHDAVVAVKFS